MEITEFIAKSTQFSSRSRFSDAQISQVAEGGKDRIATWVSDAASQQGLSLHARPVERFARAVSRLSDGVVDLDVVEEKLIALSRAGLITAYQRGLLQVQYLR